MEKLCLFSAVGLMLVTVTCMYRWFLAPALAKLEPASALQALFVIHCFRFISPISLVPGVTLPGLSTEFAYPQVLGDVTSAVLALITIAALRSGWRSAVVWAWFSNVFGALDLTVVSVQGFRFDFAEHIGAMFYVVVWFVPWLLLSHVLIFARLAQGQPLRLAQRNMRTASA